jgi:hypothetical protein
MGQFRRPLFWVVFFIVLVLAAIGGVLVISEDVPDGSRERNLPERHRRRRRNAADS